MSSRFHWLTFFTVFLALTACTSKRAELGTSDNPVKMHFVPSVDAKMIEDSTVSLKNYLEKNTPYKFEISVPQSFVAVVEAFGTKRADVAAVNTFGYVKAHDMYGAEARMTVIRHGSATYQSQFITKTDSPIKKLEDLAGKTIAFVDPSSASGYLLPLKTLNDRKIVPKGTMFAQKHDAVISAIYQGKVDAGATFYTPPSKDEKGVERLEDARRLVLTQYPNVAKEIRIIELSDPIPNDPIIFRKDMPEEMKVKIEEAIFGFVATAEGKAVFNKIYGVTEFKKVNDDDYKAVRAMMNELSKNATDAMKK